MQELFNDPRAYLAVLAIGGLIFAVGRWVGAVNSDRESLKDLMAEVRKDIKEILSRLPSNVVANDSPLRLTKLGRQASAAIGARALARDLAQELLSQVAGKRPHEIFRLCTAYVDDTFEPTPDQSEQFDAAAYELGISRSEVRQVIAVELRDHLLARVSPAPRSETEDLDYAAPAPSAP